MRILVTGGAGFIGSHLCERLINLGHETIALDNLSTGQNQNLANLINNDKFNLVKGDVLNEDLVLKLISNVDYVFHFAAAVGVFNIVKNPINSLTTNIRGTENVLRACSKFNVDFFLASSSEVYGKNTSDSLNEFDDRILGPTNILRWSYSDAKAIDESLTFAYFDQSELNTRIVRFFNTVGPRQSGDYGMVVPRFVTAALKNQPLYIYGSGKQTRCFIHVYDVIDAVVLLAFDKKSIGKVFNIGNKSEISIHDLAIKIINQTKSRSEVKWKTYSEIYGSSFEDMYRRVPNLELISSNFGWSPKRDLSEIISDIKIHLNSKNI
jgi:UDP-glucose 4-epimerase